MKHTRINGWETKLKHIVEKHMALPSQYGVSDCYIFPDDIVEAITGKKMFGAAVRRYKTELGAAKQLRKKGFETVQDAFSHCFEEIPVSLAQRGDIGVVHQNGEVCGGVFVAQGFAIRDTKIIRFISPLLVDKAFKVGR